MIIPIRCFTCGKEIASKWERFEQMREEGRDMEEVWKELGIKRYCCMRMLSSHVNIIDDLLEFARLQ